MKVCRQNNFLSWLALLAISGRFLAPAEAAAPISSVDNGNRVCTDVFVSLNDTAAGLANLDDKDDETLSCPTTNINVTATSTAATSSKNSLTDGRVWELGYDNFESVIGSASFTFVLMYDRMDVTTTQRRGQWLDQLAATVAQMKQPASVLFRSVNVNFAKLDIRRHNYIRSIYTPNDDGEPDAWDEFYDEELSSQTFMRQQDVYLPSNWTLFYGANYNVVDFVEEEEDDDSDDAHHRQVQKLRKWLFREIKNSIHYAMEGINKPQLAFKESKYGPEPSAKSRINIERELQRKARKADNSFNFSNLDKQDEDAASSNATNTTASPDLLSYYVKPDSQSGDKFYKYRYDASVEDVYSSGLMDTFKGLLQRYLTWAEGYEVLWDEDRKRKEDEQTNYGYYLEQMNEQVKDLLLSVFEDIGAEDSVLDIDDIPDLGQYYAEIIFGYGRSPSALSDYLEEEVFAKMDGPSASRGLGSTHMRRIALFECIRDLMKVKETCEDNEERYEMYFKTMAIKMHAILAEFQENLTRHYLSYRKANNIPNGERFNFRSLNVLDMQDPANYGILSSYDEFERQYTAKGIPVVLSNVNMTDNKFTVEYLVKRCGFMDVTQSIQVSHNVGDSRVDSWGGLTGFKLPRDMVTESRLTEDGYDKSISFKQFVILSQRIKTLYLHDYTLKGSCDRLFYDKTPYDTEQHFRIPAVVGQYDLFQKLAKSGYQRSWPSLFVGLKGSNSKVHVDSGATGFFMYLISGRKRWIVYEHSARPFLYERVDDNSFIADVLALNMNNETNERMDESFPLLRRGIEGGYEFIQEAGQLVYIPPNSPHAVENLDDIVGISMNFAPRAGVASRLHDLITDANSEFDDIEITLRYLMFEGGRETLAQTKDPLYASLGEYEAQL